MDLALLLQQAIAASREEINIAQGQHPGEPIQVLLDWHPRMQKVELVIRPSIRTAPYKAA